MKTKKRKAVFLDRDGTLIKDKHYLAKIELVEFYKNAIYALQEMIKEKFLLFIISNQSGIGRGYFTEEDHLKVDKYIINILKKEKIVILKSYYSPYYEKSKLSKYRKGKSFRKPNIGMLLKAQKEFNIDLQNSFVIGDKLSDIDAGAKAGCKTILVLTGKGKIEKKKINRIKPDYICRDLKGAFKYL